ncbi:MAG: hypothetical protein AUG08_01545 [Acidobacteria bacterium 13_1_20CM_2_55_15]|nr:MAG: hypothetical protein AUG08_01545 [Acidobacteria bacterium 13_1_20CM_2_55_15]
MSAILWGPVRQLRPSLQWRETTRLAAWLRFTAITDMAAGLSCFAKGSTPLFYENKYAQLQILHPKKKAAKLGLQLVPLQ